MLFNTFFLALFQSALLESLLYSFLNFVFIVLSCQAYHSVNDISLYFATDYFLNLENPHISITGSTFCFVFALSAIRTADCM